MLRSNTSIWSLKQCYRSSGHRVQQADEVSRTLFSNAQEVQSRLLCGSLLKYSILKQWGTSHHYHFHTLLYASNVKTELLLFSRSKAVSKLLYGIKSTLVEGWPLYQLFKMRPGPCLDAPIFKCLPAPSSDNENTKQQRRNT